MFKYFKLLKITFHYLLLVFVQLTNWPAFQKVKVQPMWAMSSVVATRLAQSCFACYKLFGGVPPPHL